MSWGNALKAAATAQDVEDSIDASIDVRESDRLPQRSEAESKAPKFPTVQRFDRTDRLAASVY
jgi:hypothetical protein